MELNQILLQIDSLKKEAEDFQPVKPELERVFWDKFRLEFNYNSNHMEGNTLTYGHTQILLKSGDVVGKYNIRELQEMKAHDLALKIIRESADDSEFQLSQKFIKEINQLILVEPFYNEAITQDGKPTQKLITPGEYKKTPNSVRLHNGEMYFHPSPEETPALMSDLIDWYQKEKDAKELHPLQIAALFHYKIVRIHPFDDSNGRTARLLMNYILMKNDFAPLVVESNDKKNYLIALQEADAGDMESFFLYICNISLRWQQLYTKAVKGEKIEEEGDFDKELDLLKKKLSKNKGPKLEISEETVKNIMYRSVVPLIKSIEKKLAKFQDLFTRINFFLAYPEFSQNFDNIDLLENYVNSIITNLKSGGELKIDFTHIGFNKAGTNIFDINSSITIQFLSFTYKINVNNQSTVLIDKLYDENFSDEEIETIAKEIAKIELEEIQKRTK